MTTFEEFKGALIAFGRSQNACSSDVTALEQAQNITNLKAIIAPNLGWLFETKARADEFIQLLSQHKQLKWFTQDAKNNNRATPLHWAENYKNTAVIELLKQHAK